MRENSRIQILNDLITRVYAARKCLADLTEELARRKEKDEKVH